MNKERDVFWGEDLKILINKERLNEIFPSDTMTRSEKLNSVTRLIIYISLALSMYNKNIKYMYITLISMGVVLFMVKNDANKVKEGFVEKVECQAPTKNNPFMNVLMSDYSEAKEKKIACSTSDIEIKKAIDKNYDDGLYKDSDNLFDKKNSQRQFYTNPSTTIPNDQDSYSKWLYKSTTSCKEDSVNCSDNIYERLQQQKFIFPNPEENPYSSKKTESPFEVKVI
jgi:hypothetical protein